MQPQEQNEYGQMGGKPHPAHSKRPSYDSVVQGAQQTYPLDTQMSQMNVGTGYDQAPQAAPAPTQYNAPYQQSSFNPSGNLPQTSTLALMGAIPQMSSLRTFPSAFELPSCHPSLMNCTFARIPNSPSLLSKTKAPLGLVVTPHSTVEVPIVSGTGIVRCRRCRSYLNPYVEFVDQGARYICNFCFLTNDIPPEFDFDSRTRQPIDRLSHRELMNSVVEFEATSEYMVRPPQAPIFLFLLDVSQPAVGSGNFSVTVQSIMHALETLKELPRAKIAFILFDDTLKFYSFDNVDLEPREFVVADLDESFIPCPEDSLLVSLERFYVPIRSFLEKLLQFSPQYKSTSNCLGSALKSGFKLIANYGGKIIVHLSSIPNHREGALKLRDDPMALGTPKESILLQPATLFYKNIAIECTRLQVGIDLFVTPASGPFLDLATLGNCVTYTGGHLYHYAGFRATNSEDILKYSNDVNSLLNAPFGLEAVLRIRASKGIQINSYYGNFFMRSADLLSLPNVNYKHSYAIQATIDETITRPFASFQSALLYTTSTGERRIRVSTLSVPTTDNLFVAMSSLNQAALANVFCKIAVEKCIASKLEDSREWLFSRCAEIINAHRAILCPSSPNTQLLVTESSSLLALLTLGILKCKAFKPGTNVTLDERSSNIISLRSLSVERTNALLLPYFFPIHKMLPGLEDEAVGTADPSNPSFIIMPHFLNLTSEKLASSRDGIFVLYNGFNVVLWIGSQVNPVLLQSLFGIDSFATLRSEKMTLLVEGNESSPTYSFNRKIHTVLNSLRSTFEDVISCNVLVVKEDSEPQLRLAVLNQLIEDRTDNYWSYPQFLLQLRDKLTPQ